MLRTTKTPCRCWVEEWPDFVKSAKNNCLVGCMTCQTICPCNKGFSGVGTTSSVRFNQEETDYVLGASRNNSQEVVQGVYEKLEKLGLLSYKEYIVRNIRACISNVSADKLNCT